jgi:hypothetical protein
MSDRVTLPNHKRGDRWVGLTFGPILFDGNPPGNTLARIRMHFRQDKLVYRLDTDGTSIPARNHPITIDNAATWTATIAPVESGFLPSDGLWEFDVEFWATGEGPQTLISGSIFITPDVTQ